jgi:hypothetical protein
MEDRPISKGQLRRIQTLWGILYKHSGEAGSGARGDEDSRKLRLAWIGLKIGRQIQSCNDLTQAEAKTAIDAIQKLLPPDLVRPPRRGDRGQARAQGTAGRKGMASKEVKLPDAGTMQLLQNLMFALGWDRAGLDRFLHSPKSPVRGSIRTLADANKIIWVLKGMLRRRKQNATHESHDHGSDGRNSGADTSALS